MADEADKLETVKEQIEEVNLDKLTASVEEAPVIKLANLILIQAIKDRASDIHIEPFDKHGAPALPRRRRAHRQDRRRPVTCTSR